MNKNLPKAIDGVESLRPFSRIKLIALDLDGTLVESNTSSLPKRIIELTSSLKNYRYQQVRVTIATGRTLSGARALIQELPLLSDTPIILYNGSVIIKNNLVLEKKWIIPFNAFIDVLKIASRYDVTILAYSFNSDYNATPQGVRIWLVKN